jgi:hypothetical protein
MSGWTMTTPGYGYAYAWRNGPRWAFWYLRLGRVKGFLRIVWFTLIRGHIGEACQECGMPYLLWWAEDDLYATVTGRGRYSNGESAPGLYCLDCFDRKARKQGIRLCWKPEVNA